MLILVSDNAEAMLYNEIEATLMRALNVDDERRPAFRARLRHLRNIGVPSGITATGKGKCIKFTETQLLELFIVLSLEEIGFSPAAATDIARGDKHPIKSGPVSLNISINRAIQIINAARSIRCL